MKISNTLFKLALVISLVNCGGDKKSSSEGGQDNPNTNGSDDATGSLVDQGIGAMNEGVEFKLNKLDYDYTDKRDFEKDFETTSRFKSIVRDMSFSDGYASSQCEGPEAVIRKNENEFFGKMTRDNCDGSTPSYISYEAVQYQKCEDSTRLMLDSIGFKALGLSSGYDCKSGEYMARSTTVEGEVGESVTWNHSTKSVDGKTCKFEEEDGKRKSLNDCLMSVFVSEADQEDYRGINVRYTVKKGFVSGESTLDAKGEVLVEKGNWKIEFTFPGEGKDLTYRAVGPNATFTGTLVLWSYGR